MKGNNLNGPSDHFLIPTNITELDQRLIGWNIIFGASIDGTENKYSATMRFSQGNGNMLADKIHASGLHNSEKVIIGFARFIAQAEYTKGRLGAESSTAKQLSTPHIHS
ncbi:hypothetical protein GUA87_12810 [Sneathiella sp. P13V-1]|uniref:hypothetical protein n=1 Tax=Sneathiella sp. P13V-1 TaxID=2697366 RepID=UPI00187BB226|nr:hypothetical protein [Sneathiella sp. P13V-1]MBE7637729.1 hypothetical protein [Sneathiella sp. P13V-1]